MSLVRDAIREHAARTPERVALSDGRRRMSYSRLDAAITRCSKALAAQRPVVLGLIADNGVDWIVADLAAAELGIPLVPLPLFFSPAQMRHALADSGVDLLLTDRPDAIAALLAADQRHAASAPAIAALPALEVIRLASRPRRRPASVPAGTLKLTYTSGTTGEPKGVCLSAAQLEAVARSLVVATAAGADDRHLCLTPLSTLLENVGGAQVALLAGACVHVPPLAEVGLTGASGLDAARMVQALTETSATSAILVPQMLQALLAVVESGVRAPPKLRFVAVGGAPVSRRLLARANALALPVFEGYGLSECASVVALNTPAANRPGTVGRPLPHLTLGFGPDHEILVDGPHFPGYLGDASASRPWPTGDIGYLDDDGYLHLQGRKKSQFITSFGRNVAPEWVERELASQPGILQAAVFGEARPFNTAVITAPPGHSDGAIADAIAIANLGLPDYARVARFVRSRQPFTVHNLQLTGNGRLRRAEIWAAYSESINALYPEVLHVVP